ncbi:SAM-dependent methyltransferase [Marinicella meishanensis]|uniref:SAM-dependent methyltransferase n=1 Tax=Marinicella meishanensis TaxID=2873263 RepID=UPI001CBD83EB|nr:SAM-dependent methyltransferase [Marinicella sp. NBU2979]
MKGSLVNVGLGMTLGSHITPLSRNFIEQADVVFVAASNQLVEEWVKTMNDHVISLQPLYAEGKSRKQTYQEMNEAIMTEVRAGKKVCGAFYGHPGVFALTPHQTIQMAREEGFKAHMEPGISAEDCLYADLGIDPGTYGMAHFEANNFMFNQTVYDPSAYLVLWQIALAGDRTLKVFETTADAKQLLVDMLLEHYPADHEVIIYECAVLPIEQPLIKPLSLQKLAHAEVSLKSTLVIPPAVKKQKDHEKINRLLHLEHS